MDRRTFDQLVNLKLIGLEQDDTLDNLKETANKLYTEYKKLGKTYLGAKIENVAINILETTNKIVKNNQKLENCFDNMTNLLLRG